MQPACARCQFFESRGSGGGACRLDSPTVVTVPDRDDTDMSRPLTVWPLVRDTDWCGNFKAATVGS